MDRHLSVLRLVLLITSLVSALSCGSKNDGEKASNAGPNNGNSNAASPSSRAGSRSHQHDPKEVCAWLPEFTPAEYKFYTGTMYNCKSNHREELGGGKRLSWTYEAFGTSPNIEYVELTMASNNPPAVTQKAEGRFVKMAEALWQKSFAKPLPDEIKNELLANKGQPRTSHKDWSFEKTAAIPTDTKILHTDAGQGISALKFIFYLPK